MPRWDQVNGSPDPLGCTWIRGEQAYNFALYSKHATRVTLLFYSGVNHRTPLWTFEFDEWRNRSSGVWHCRIPAAKLVLVQFYGYRIEGPSTIPGLEFHQFDSDKVLLDPYAQSVFFPPDFDREAASRSGRNDGMAPLARLCQTEDAFDWKDDAPVRHDSDLIIYEMHVKGFTANPNSGLAPLRRGTFSGIIDKIPYLVELGVTAVELMPIHQFDPTEVNYWGYMTLNFFAPHHRYAQDADAGEQRNEFRELVRELHVAGIEVILDVVYNHTTEGGLAGPNYSFKGIDACSYYMIDFQHPDCPYANFSGTGNTFLAAHPTVRRLVLDSLRFWVEEMHVDGFRFDLASVLTRNSDGSLNADDPPLFSQIAADPVLNRVRLIAEEWDFDMYNNLRFPGTAWSLWNARYRDASQAFLRGDPNSVGEMMTRVYGSTDMFPDEPDAYHPCQSINYVVSHDGFTLYDLCSYNTKRNWPNGHNNTDGANDRSWNCGWEGDDGVPGEVLALRKRQVKNAFSLLMLSNGTPMFRMGDEFLQTQLGNNNPYNQDNETTWLDWDRLQAHRDVFRFFQIWIRFRKEHPTLSRSVFWRGDVHWYGPDGPCDFSPESRSFAYCLRGAAEGNVDLYVMLNFDAQPRTFRVQEGHSQDWSRFIDTAFASPEEIYDEGHHPGIASLDYRLDGRAVAVLTRHRSYKPSNDVAVQASIDVLGRL